MHILTISWSHFSYLASTSVCQFTPYLRMFWLCKLCSASLSDGAGKSSYSKAKAMLELLKEGATNTCFLTDVYIDDCFLTLTTSIFRNSWTTSFIWGVPKYFGLKMTSNYDNIRRLLEFDGFRRNWKKFFLTDSDYLFYHNDINYALSV